MRSFVEIKSSRNGEISLSFTDIDESYLSRELLTSQICLLHVTLFAKINSRENFRAYSSQFYVKWILPVDLQWAFPI